MGREHMGAEEIRPLPDENYQEEDESLEYLKGELEFFTKQLTKAVRDNDKDSILALEEEIRDIQNKLNKESYISEVTGNENVFKKDAEELRNKKMMS
ncbi:MAG: hypothetical protein ACM3KM_02505 [Acidobacteriaceae bacterium]